MSVNNELTTIRPMAIERSENPSGMSITDMERMGTYIANSRMFGIETQDQAVALMMLCQSEGLHPMQAVRRFHLIKGKASMRADAMLAEFQDKDGTVEWGDRTNERVSGTFTHPKGGQLTVTWAMQDAIKAGLTGNPTWQKFPRQMLTARVISEAIRTILPGVVSGIYTPEEVSDFDDAPRPRTQSPQGPPSQPARQPMQTPAASPHSPEPKALSGPVTPVPNVARDAFVSVAASCGKTFKDGRERGEYANICLGRPRDSTKPFSDVDWQDAAAALPGVLEDEKREYAAPIADTAPPVVEAAKTEAQLDAEGESLTDPFAEEGEDPFDKIPAGQPTHAKSKKSAPANSLPGTDRTATDSRATGSPAGML